MKSLSICITTFKERESLVCELIKNISAQVKDLNFDIIVAVNGNNNEKMDEGYRQRITAFCASIPRCYPIICPEFKSLAKLWNTLVIFSSTEYNLILNDDIDIQPGFFEGLYTSLNSTKYELFTINGGFSHFIISKRILHRLGYFDERFIAFGEEDGDIVHRHISMFKMGIPVLHINGIRNTLAYDKSSKNLEVHIDNKPRFNREFAGMKYKFDKSGIMGMSPVPVKQVIPDIIQYPYEMFVLANRHNISKFDKVIT